MNKPSNKIISIYLTIGILWIILSDWAFSYFNYPENPVYQTIKGIAFIFISGFIFWLMLRKYESKNHKYLLRLKNIAEELQLSNNRYLVVTKATNNIIWDYDLKKEEVLWGDALTRILGYTERLNHSNWWTNKIHNDDRERVNTKFRAFIQSHDTEKWSDEYRIVTDSGEIKYMYDRGYLLFNKKGKPIRMIGSMEDISERKLNEKKLQDLNIQINNRVEELAASNAELEQFAYIASHDLQEPLRMITRFLSEIERKYNEQLDEKGRQYIHFAVDGAKRMRHIILDLLDYSKVGKLDQNIESIDLNKLLEEIVHFNGISLKDSHATIEWENLPTIENKRTLLQMVFQNILVNALKYRQEEVNPVIKITFEDLVTHWKFCISDNGIGINPEFFDKIFEIFQRLHANKEYSGTGIGLAICKKIIESQGGKIWVESEENKGSSFYFTVRK